MAEFAQGLGFDLPDTLSCDVEFLADLFESPRSSVIETESESEHLLLPLSKCTQHLHQLLLEQCECGCVSRYRHVVILDEVAQMAVFLFADGRLKGNRLLGDLEDLAYSLYRDLLTLTSLLIVSTM